MSASVVNIRDEVALVLTSSIDVKGMTSSSRPDPKERERDYAGTLKYYLNEHPDFRRIVFIENSGWPLDRLKSLAEQENPHRKQVEFISLSCNDFPRELGKSYGEMLLLDQGLAQSRVAAEVRYLTKITGRLYLMNVTQLLGAVRRPFEFMVDLRDHGLYEMVGSKNCGRFSDTRCVVTTPAFYDEALRGKYVTLNEEKGRFIENLLYDVAKDPKFMGRTIRRFPVEPDFRGVAGHLNKNYGSLKETVKRRLRAGLRVVAPWLYV
jgi:hypothetical protein